MFLKEIVMLSLFLGVSVAVNRTPTGRIFNRRVNIGAHLPNSTCDERKTFFINTQLRVDWLSAHLACRNYEYELATISNAREQDALINDLRDVYGSISVWLGATNLNAENGGRPPFTAEDPGFYWLNGQPINYQIRWLPNEPSNLYSERCLELSERNNVLGFNDASCNKLNVFICQMDEC